MAKKNESYEEQFEKLEKIVERMDNGELSLMDSMKDYEEGIKLCNKLFKTLNEAEGKIKVISESNDEVDFEPKPQQ
ncbi:MAG: exodeoxyribonuclease VII small subunit [Solirubrobacterales bacterium]